MKIRLKLIAIAAGAFFYSLGANAQDGKTLFKSCTACHTIGGGKLVGPDLAGVQDRRPEDEIVKFVQNPADFDVMMMPAQNLSDAEVKSILAYIISESPSEEEASEEVAEVIEEPADPALDPANASAEDIAMGMKLFTGEEGLENGGASCLSCHNVQHDAVLPGGFLAKDLTLVYERMGSAGISGILSSPPFPAMNASYKDKALTEKEIFQLSAFFSDAATNNIYQHKRNNNSLLIYGGGGAFVLIIIIIFVLFLERKRKCVKEDIYKN